MFRIENNDIYYIQEPMIDWIHYGKVFIAEPTEIENQLQIKKFNGELGIHEPSSELTEFEYNGRIYSVTNGLFTYVPEIVEETVSEPTQLDRIEAAVNKTQQDIIDEYTLELIESGAL